MKRPLANYKMDDAEQMLFALGIGIGFSGGIIISFIIWWVFH